MEMKLRTVIYVSSSIESLSLRVAIKIKRSDLGPHPRHPNTDANRRAPPLEQTEHHRRPKIEKLRLANRGPF